jgi:hypothetical protein
MNTVGGHACLHVSSPKQHNGYRLNLPNGAYTISGPFFISMKYKKSKGKFIPVLFN